MVFMVEGKVALITGGASGLGLCYAKIFLQNGLKAVTLADIDATVGEESAKKLNEVFGNGKAIFVKTDVTDIKQFEDAFKETISAFKNCDILVNNAGILNDSVWEKEVAINVNGVIHGIWLGLENYLSNYKSGEDAVIINASSVAGVQGYGFIPVYCGTKFAVFGMTKAWGVEEHYNRKKVRVIAVCPGATDTPLMTIKGKCFNNAYNDLFTEIVTKQVPYLQRPDFLAEQVLEITKYAKNGSIWVVEDDEPAYEFIQPLRETFKENLLKKE